MATLKLRDASPLDLQGRTLTFVGCGNVGSRAARICAYWGADKIVLCDFDVVEDKNVLGSSSQVYRKSHVGRPKVEALAEILTEINSAIQVSLWNRKFVEVEELSGIVLVGLDEFEGRMLVRESCMQETSTVSLLIEGRLGEDEGRVFALDPQNFLHQDCYCDHEIWKPWTKADIVGGECGETHTSVMLAELAAMTMTMSLWKWLLKERGSEEPVPNDTVFWVEPTIESNAIVWSTEE